MAKKATVESASTEVLDEILTPKTPKKKAKPITEPEPKTLDEIGEMTAQAIAEATEMNEAQAEAEAEVAMTIEEKNGIIADIKQKSEEISEVFNNNPEKGLELVKEEIERVSKVEEKVKADQKKKVSLKRVIYGWNGQIFE